MKLRAKIVIFGALLGISSAGLSDPPEILRITPTSGPEGTRVEITGRRLDQATTVFFDRSSSTFKVVSSEKIIALVPPRIGNGDVMVVTPEARVVSPFPFVVLNDPRIPGEVKFRAGYINSLPRPPEFSSVLLWGIAIADPRVAGFKSAAVEVAETQLSCRADGKDIVLNDDRGAVRGGLYRRVPWFGTDQHEPMPMAYDDANHAVILRVGQRSDKVWHFWSASSRPPLPPGNLAGCTVRARVKISERALLQMGMDYWRNPTIGYGTGGNNHEAGASNWYFPSDRWQEALFTDIGGPQF